MNKYITCIILFALVLLGLRFTPSPTGQIKESLVVQIYDGDWVNYELNTVFRGDQATLRVLLPESGDRRVNLFLTGKTVELFTDSTLVEAYTSNYNHATNIPIRCDLTGIDDPYLYLKFGGAGNCSLLMVVFGPPSAVVPLLFWNMFEVVILVAIFLFCGMVFLVMPIKGRYVFAIMSLFLSVTVVAGDLLLTFENTQFWNFVHAIFYIQSVILAIALLIYNNRTMNIYISSAGSVGWALVIIVSVVFPEHFSANWHLYLFVTLLLLVATIILSIYDALCGNQKLFPTITACVILLPFLIIDCSRRLIVGSAFGTRAYTVGAALFVVVYATASAYTAFRRSGTITSGRSIELIMILEDIMNARKVSSVINCVISGVQKLFGTTGGCYAALITNGTSKLYGKSFADYYPVTIFKCDIGELEVRFEHEADFSTGPSFNILADCAKTLSISASSEQPDDFVFVLGDLMDSLTKSPSNRTIRIIMICQILSYALTLKETEVTDICNGVALRLIGRVKMPDSIDEECCLIGEDMIKAGRNRILSVAQSIALYQFERYDGKGVLKTAGADIPLYALIYLAADFVERNFDNPQFEALVEEENGKQLAPQLCEVIKSCRAEIQSIFEG